MRPVDAGSGSGAGLVAHRRVLDRKQDQRKHAEGSLYGLGSIYVSWTFTYADEMTSLVNLTRSPRPWQDYPSMAADFYDQRWAEFRSMRESEEGGTCIDLNVTGGTRFWYATCQSTRVRTSLMQM
jgi:hypothetical protein